MVKALGEGGGFIFSRGDKRARHRSQIPADAGGDPCRGVPDRIASKVSIPGCSLHLCVTEQLPDHREAVSQGQRPRSIRVAEVMDAVVVQFDIRAGSLNRLSRSGLCVLGFAPGATQALSGSRGRAASTSTADRERLVPVVAGYPVDTVHLRLVEIRMRPEQGHNSGLAAACPAPQGGSL